jgi:hypothetical protein
VLDRDCAGVGPAGIDPGSLRCDAAWCHGVEAAEHILRGWEAEAGRPASDVRPPRTRCGGHIRHRAIPSRHGLHPVSVTKQITGIR